eukprot:scaffold100219_cov66-Phaeocystis_antarctica.AAC.2
MRPMLFSERWSRTDERSSAVSTSIDQRGAHQCRAHAFTEEVLQLIAPDRFAFPPPVAGAHWSYPAVVDRRRRRRQAHMLGTSSQLRSVIADRVEYSIQRYDADQRLSYSHYDVVLMKVTDEMCSLLVDELRAELSSADLQLIDSRVSQLVDEQLAREGQPTKTRFQKFERVVCRIGGEEGWAPGTIQALDEVDPEDPTGQSTLPYVVKLDAPIGRLISVPSDDNSLCRAEVCFGHRSVKLASGCSALSFTLRCKPQAKGGQKLRFCVADRVTCAIEDESGDFTVWSAGKVTDVGYDMEQDVMCEDRDFALAWNWAKRPGVVPYRVLLDSGVAVNVHRDVHWLVRDLALQPAGPRQSEDGERNVKRLVKRRCGESSSWECIDHATRKVRIQEGVDSSDDDSDS